LIFLSSQLHCLREYAHRYKAYNIGGAIDFRLFSFSAAVMVYTCCVPGCRTGYRPTKKETLEAVTSCERISVFKFPNDENLRKKWIRAIPIQHRIGKKLAEFTPTPSHRVCELHFTERDFDRESTDLSTSRKNARDNTLLKHIRLKPAAIPSVFPNCPSYLSKETKSCATEEVRIAGTSFSRREREEDKIIENERSFFEAEKVSTLSDLKEKIKLQDFIMPDGFVYVERPGGCTFLYMPNIDNHSECPKLSACICIDETLLLTAHVLGTQLKASTFKHICGEYVVSVTEVCNVMAYAKSFVDKSCSEKEGRHTNYVEFAADLVENFLLEDEEHGMENISVYPLLKFIAEQLRLCLLSHHARHYSPFSLTTSFIWRMTSPGLYSKLREILILPSNSRLRRLSQGTSVETNTVDCKYIHQRISELSDTEKIVTLCIDEVYTATRLEYVGGRFIGLTDEGKAAKTVLSFMVVSASSKYQDVVSLVPVSSFSTDLLYLEYIRVMDALDGLLDVCALSVDNHVCNR